MGDERYYTYFQFMSIIILTFLTIFIVASMVISSFRNKEKTDRSYVTFTFFQIALIAIGRVVEGVIPSFYIANGLRYFSSMMLITCNFTFYYYMLIYIFPIFRFNYSASVINRRFSELFVVIIGGLVFLGVNTKTKLFIKDYSFLKVTYSNFYLSMLCVLTAIIFISSVLIFISNRRIHHLYSNRTVAVLITLFFNVPMVVYIGAILLQSEFLDFIEFFLYFILGIVINIIIYSSNQFGLTALAFDKIGDMILDYVIVVDTNNNIIYKNTIANDAAFICKSEQADINNINNIFVGNVVEKKDDIGNDYIQLILDEENYFFIYKYKALINQRKNIGYMITITDISELMSLLYYLEERKENAEEANEKLVNYSKVVYQLEKEKQINRLLEEIIATREKSMESLYSKIEVLENKLYEEDFEICINEAIELNAEILKDIRQAVTAYREHYGGRK